MSYRGLGCFGLPLRPSSVLLLIGKILGNVVRRYAASSAALRAGLDMLPAARRLRGAVPASSFSPFHGILKKISIGCISGIVAKRDQKLLCCLFFWSFWFNLR